MIIRELIAELDTIVPLGAVGYDRDAVGLQVGSATAQLKRVLVAYELTDEIIEEALEIGANLIVAFHPLLFPSITSVTDATRSGKLVRKLILSDIGLYVLHTAFDAHREFGTSRLMAEALDLDNIKPLKPLSGTLQKLVVFVPHTAARKVSQALAGAGAGQVGNYSECSFQVEGRGTYRGNDESNPHHGEPNVLESVDEVRVEMLCESWNVKRAVAAMLAAHPYEEVAYDLIPLSNESPNFGMGAIGEWASHKEIREVLGLVKQAFGCPVLRYSATSGRSIRRIATLGGAGMEFYGAARNAKVDAFITADVRYHDFYKAHHDDLLLIDSGHAETERYVQQGMLQAVTRALTRLGTAAEELRNVALAARNQPNAVRYFGG